MSKDRKRLPHMQHPSTFRRCTNAHHVQLRSTLLTARRCRCRRCLSPLDRHKKTSQSSNRRLKLYDARRYDPKKKAKSWQELASHAVKAFQAFLFWLELSVGRAPSAAHLVRVQMAPEGARGREWNLEWEQNWGWKLTPIVISEHFPQL